MYILCIFQSVMKQKCILCVKWQKRNTIKCFLGVSYIDFWQWFNGKNKKEIYKLRLKGCWAIDKTVFIRAKS